MSSVHHKSRKVPRVMKKHILNVTQLMSLDAERATLLVGPEKTSIECHKTLLGYYSEFFEAAIYGGFKEARTGVIELPDERREDVAAFVNWLYTGAIVWDGELEDGQMKPCGGDVIGPVPLWVLGNKFLSPEFSNAAMARMMAHFADGACLEALTAEYAYGTTLEGSLLRDFIKDLITTEGPFSAEVSSYWRNNTSGPDFIGDWTSLLAKGGDLVKDCCVAGFKEFSAFADRPWSEYNRQKYLYGIHKLTVEEWWRKLTEGPSN